MGVEVVVGRGFGINFKIVRFSIKIYYGEF